MYINICKNINNFEINTDLLQRHIKNLKVTLEQVKVH